MWVVRCWVGGDGACHAGRAQVGRGSPTCSSLTLPHPRCCRSERQIATMTWPELAHRLVQVGGSGWFGAACAAQAGACCCSAPAASAQRPLALPVTPRLPAPPTPLCTLQVQRRRLFCMARELGEADIVARVMRKENYLIGMLNKVGRSDRRRRKRVWLA